MHRYFPGAIGMAVVAISGLSFLVPVMVVAQPASVTIPSLANASRPNDLDFTAGECDLDASGKTMDCVFQQVFLTLSPLDKSTCLVTTNRYARTFERESPTRWTSREGPTGPCGVVDIATLDDGGATRWTMELRTTNAGDARCGAPEPPVVLSWQNVIRPLPCTRIQPGAMSR
jgi:hypothetical protein